MVSTRGSMKPPDFLAASNSEFGLGSGLVPTGGIIGRQTIEAKHMAEMFVDTNLNFSILESFPLSKMAGLVQL